MRLLSVLRRALTLRCPRCGGSRLFTGWVAMARACALCGLRYERAQGYWVGAIYVNYGVTTVIALLGFFLTWPRWSMRAELVVWGTFVVVFPVWFFRYSRSLWLAVETLVNPEL
ncbi:MAG: DUF983 domain-containing protein [Candidatus Rokubacteria bacterium]|nr:DUF983 domain-containing protein [Candidatus Rokubacteria bacterium]